MGKKRREGSCRFISHFITTMGVVIQPDNLPGAIAKQAKDVTKASAGLVADLKQVIIVKTPWWLEEGI